MRNLITIVIILLATMISSTAFANNHQAARERRQAEVNSVAAKYCGISPTIFKNVEKLMGAHDIKRSGSWTAKPLGFSAEINDDTNSSVLIKWDGDVIWYKYEGWNGTKLYILGTWE